MNRKSSSVERFYDEENRKSLIETGEEITNYNGQTTNNRQYTMTEYQNKKPYDLEKRTLEYAKEVIRLCKKLPSNTVNYKLISQLVDAAGSVGANYREANEALSKKDFAHRMKITRKEAKESSFWLELLKEANPGSGAEIDKLYKESRELRNIFTSIIEKTK